MSDSEDREAIRHLMAVYNVNGDRGRVAALADVFTADGVLAFSGEETTGRASIIARLSAPVRRSPTPVVARHHLTTSLVELDGDAATARTYFQVLTSIGLDHHGHYADRLVRTPEGWRIARREVRIDYQSPDSLFPPLHVRGQAPAGAA